MKVISWVLESRNLLFAPWQQSPIPLFPGTETWAQQLRTAAVRKGMGTRLMHYTAGKNGPPKVNRCTMREMFTQHLETRGKAGKSLPASGHESCCKLQPEGAAAELLRPELAWRVNYANRTR